MKLVVVSPHPDDAAFSCGIALSLSVAANVEVQIINIYTRSAYAPFATPSSIEEISRIRKLEDASMNDTVGQALLFADLELCDAPIRLDIDARQTLDLALDKTAYLQEVESLQRLLQRHLDHADCFLLPLALGNHVDHLITRDAGMRCGPAEKIALYEDLPYAARLADSDRVRLIESFTSAKHPGAKAVTLRSVGGTDIKRRLASCYPSQVDSATVEEMVNYGRAHGDGEMFYAGEQAFRIFDKIAPCLE